MQIAVISDLHLGRGDKADRFGHDDAEFMRFLDHLEGSFERIVLLGDIYETLTCPTPRRQVEELQACQAAHSEIVQRFRGPRYQYIHGNHDLVAGHIQEAPTSVRLDVDGQRILFTHGHGYDWIIRNARWLSENTVWFLGWLMRVGLAPVVKALDHLDNLFGGVSSDPHECGFQRWAVDLARRQDADVIVTGHTHVGLRSEHGDRLFLNSGSCAEGHFSWLSMDTGTGAYAVNAGW